MDRKNIRWILVIIAILIFLSVKNTFPKEAVADIEGKGCIVDKDCPCLGTYNVTEEIEAWGIGVGRCREVENTCDMSYCFDVQETGIWLRDHPWAWARENTLAVLAIITLLIIAAMWPMV